MTALTEAFVAVRPDMGPFEPELKQNLGRIDTSKEGKKVGQKFGDGLSSTVGGLAKKASGLVAGAFATLQAGKFLKDAIGSASDLGETTSKVAQIFGPAAKDIQAFASKADTALGQTQQAALDANATFGLFGKSAGLQGKALAGFTTKLTSLAGDLASFNNTTPEQAIEAIGAALRGESEPIRAYGVLLDDATLKAEAMRLGLVKTTKDTVKIEAANIRSNLAWKALTKAIKEHGKGSTEAKRAEASYLTAHAALKTATEGSIQPLTQQQKVLAAQSAIFKQTGAAQGDFARTSAGLANQQRIASAQTAKLKVAIGTALLPVVVAATTALNTKLLPPLIALAQKHGPELAKALTDLSVKAGPFIHNFLEKVGPALKNVGPAIAGLKDGTGEASPALKSLADSGAKLGPVFQDLKDKIPSVTDVLNVSAVAFGFLADHTDLLRKALPFVVAGIIAYKGAQLAANIATTLSVPAKFAEVLVNRQLVKSNRELIASRAGLVASTAVETVATTANTGAKSAGILATVRLRAAAIAQAAASKAIAVGTALWTGAQWLLNVALTANPIGLIVVGIAALIGVIILIATKTDWFQKLWKVAWGAITGAVSAAFGWVKKNWPLILAILTGPIGIAVLVIGKHWEAIKTAAQSALRFVVLKVLDFAQGILDGAAKAFGWVPGIGDKLKGAKDAFKDFRDDVNRKLGGINDQSVKVTADLKSWGTPELLAAAHGRAMGGPGGRVNGPGTTTSDQAGLFALSNKEWVIRAASTQKYGDQAMKSVNDGTATIIPGFAAGGRPGFHVNAHPPTPGQDSAAVSNVVGAVRSIGREMAPVMAKVMEKALGINPKLNRVLDFVASKVGSPYSWGAVGPGSFDCSGLVSAAINVARGRKPYSRLGATGSMPWSGFESGPGAFEIGWFQGNPGHTAATVNRVNIESAGGVGVRMGPGARGARDRLFTNRAHLKGFAKGGRAERGGDLPFDLVDPRGEHFLGKGALHQLGIEDFDRGGPWRSGTLGVNLSGKTETVVPGNGQMDLGPESIRALEKAFTRALGSGKFRLTGNGNGAYILQMSNG